jgi:hypothetical protein
VLRFNGTNWVNGDGSTIANLNASNISSGSINTARVPGLDTTATDGSTLRVANGGVLSGVNGSSVVRPLPFATQTGSVSGSFTGGNHSVTVTFASGRFSSTPKIQVTFVSDLVTGAETATIFGTVRAASSTGFTLQIRQNAGSGSRDLEFDWLALQI